MQLDIKKNNKKQKTKEMFSHKPNNVEIVLILPWSMAYFVKQFMANVIAVEPVVIK